MRLILKTFSFFFFFLREKKMIALRNQIEKLKGRIRRVLMMHPSSGVHIIIRNTRFYIFYLCSQDNDGLGVGRLAFE